ncbi:hypothetical protein ACPPVU_10900 [Mucilaginibacter sp. McL0603]|uniref:hypothetical protein n=1 Tax=Mucilaginibacter sp. McL0603 TaxID=3415670 RepID=UPI003CF348BE
MKPILIILFLFLFSSTVNAQQQFQLDDDLVYAVIKDPQGYVNIRQTPSVNAPVISKIYNYSVFSCESNKTNWWKVLYIQPDNHSKANWVEGYIHKSRVLILNNWRTPGKKDSLSVIVKQAIFEPKKHQLFYSKENPNNIRSELSKIDGKFFWGTDGEIPKEVISQIEVTIKGNLINIPKSGFDDLYEPHLKNISICHGPDNTIFISMSNSDGAGAYTIIWIIKDNKYYGRYIDDSMV